MQHPHPYLHLQPVTSTRFNLLVLLFVALVIAVALTACGEGGMGSPGTKHKELYGHDCIVAYDGDGYVSAMTCDWGPE